MNNQKNVRIFKEEEENAPKVSPPLSVMCLNIRTVFEKGVNEIVAMSASVYSDGISLCK